MASVSGRESSSTGAMLAVSPRRIFLIGMALGAGGLVLVRMALRSLIYSYSAHPLQVVNIDAMGEDNEGLVREAVRIARRAVKNGNHPFGALLYHVPSKRVIATAENTVVTKKDATGHAETNLVRIATKSFSSSILKDCTLYTSTEPCCMCAGAIYWAQIPRVVYGCSHSALYDITVQKEDDVAIRIPSAHVFNRGNGLKIETDGPIEEDFCVQIHKEFWPKLQGSHGYKANDSKQ